MRKFFLGLTFLLAFSSCSKLSTGVYWADTFAASYADDFFTFDSEQKASFRREFLSSFLEVRKNEFPQLALILEGLAAEVEAERLGEEGIERRQAEVMRVLEAAARRFEPLGQKVVARQAELGFARLDNELESRFAKQGEKLATPTAQMAQAKKRIERVIDETFEFLSKEQEALVEATLMSNPLRMELDSRRHVHQQFRGARGDPAARVAFVRRYFHDWNSLQSPDYLRARAAYQKASRDLMLKLLASASREQRQNLVENFRGRAAEFRKLARAR